MRARQGPVPPQGMGEVPRPPGALRHKGGFVWFYGQKQRQQCGMTSREAPQGQLNLAYPTGIEAEASAFGSKAPYRVVV